MKIKGIGNYYSIYNLRVAASYTIIVNFIWNNMKLEDFIMLKNIDISKYFELIRHEMKLDNKLWERSAILSNLEQGFEMIKCTSSKDCHKLVVAITKIIISKLLLKSIIKNEISIFIYWNYIIIKTMKNCSAFCL